MTKWGSLLSCYLDATPPAPRLVARTAAPAHLWLIASTVPPTLTPLTRRRRGVPFHLGFRAGYTIPSVTEQAEAGDTSLHTFAWPTPDLGSPLWYCLTDDPAQPTSAASSQPLQWPWPAEVAAPTTVILRKAGAQAVGALGAHLVTWDAVQTAVNFPVTTTPPIDYIPLPAPGIYAVTLHLDITGAGAALFIAAVQVGPDAILPSYVTPETLPLPAFTGPVTIVVANPTGGPVLVILNHVNTPNAAQLGGAAGAAAFLSITLLQAF